MAEMPMNGWSFSIEITDPEIIAKLEALIERSTPPELRKYFKNEKEDD